MASSNTKYIRKITLVLVIAFFTLLFPEVAFASPSLTIQIDPANNADIYVRDDTTEETVVYENAQSPFSYPDAETGHIYTVWVKKNGYNLLVKHWPGNPLVPNDWNVNSTGDEATGPMQNGAKSVHFNSDGIDLSVTKTCYALTAGDQNVLAYTISVSHISGWNTASSVTVTDALPAAISSPTYQVDGTPMGSWPGSNQVVLTDVLPGAIHTIKIYASVAISVTSIAGNTVDINAGASDLNTSNNSYSCTNSFTPKGKIIVDKVTDPTGDPQLFTFNPDWDSSFQLADATTPYWLGAFERRHLRIWTPRFLLFGDHRYGYPRSWGDGHCNLQEHIRGFCQTHHVR